MLDPLKILAHHTCSLCPIMFSLPSLPKHANSFILSKLVQLIQLSLILLFLEKEAFLCIPLRKNVPYQRGCLFQLLASRQVSSCPVISKDIQGEIPTDNVSSVLRVFFLHSGEVESHCQTVTSALSL